MINKNRGLIDDAVTAVFVDKDQNLWVTTTSGISHLNILVEVTYRDQTETQADVSRQDVRRVCACNQ